MDADPLVLQPGMESADLRHMSVRELEHPAGGFARERFRKRRRRWRQRYWWIFPAIAVAPVAVMLPVVLLGHVRGGWPLACFGFGLGIGAAMVLIDSPPARIENWRMGADGERDTARQLRPLLSGGWRLFNDVDTGRGNLDHVLVGPGGVFVLESKRLAGQVRVRDGRLIVRWHEDSEDGYENVTVAVRARAGAASVREQLAERGVHTWVQSVVVLWSDFDQRSIESEKVGWVRGSELAAVLSQRPTVYTGPALNRVADAVASSVDSLRRRSADGTQA